MLPIRAADDLFAALVGAGSRPANSGETVTRELRRAPAGDTTGSPSATPGQAARPGAFGEERPSLPEQETASRGAAGTRWLRALAGMAAGFYAAVNWGRQAKDRRQGTRLTGDTPCSDG